MSDEPKAAKAPWLPSEVQGWIRFFIIIGCLKWWGFDASTINQVAKSFSGVGRASGGRNVECRRYC